MPHAAVPGGEPHPLTLHPVTLHHLTLHRVALPMLAPVAASHGTTAVRDVILVGAHGEDPAGVVGWGECPTLSSAGYVGESTDAAWRWLCGGGAVATAARAGEGGPAGGLPDGAPSMAAGAVLDAVRDLAWRTRGRSAVPDGAPSALASTAVVGRQPTVDALVAAVGHEVDGGVASVKLKIAPGWDRAPLAAVRRTWPGVTLAADANGAYRGDDIPLLAGLADLDLAYIEQPLEPPTWARMGAGWPEHAPPVALDESVRSPADARVLARAGAGPVAWVNLKPARVGGVARAETVAAVLAAAAIDVFVGGMWETGVGRATALAFAASVAPGVATDLGPSSRYFADDVTEPIEWARPGFVAVPRGPGIGRAPRPDRLAAVTTERCTLAMGA